MKHEQIVTVVLETLLINVSKHVQIFELNNFGEFHNILVPEL